MRILVVSQYFWPENFRINDLVIELSQRGHQITVLTGKPNYPTGKIFPEFISNQDLYSNFKGIEVVRTPLIPRGQGGVWLSLNYMSFALNATVLGLWKLRKRKFDAIFAYEPSPITVALPAIALRAQKKVPLTFWVLDLWPETLQAIGVVKSKNLLKIVGWLVSFIYNHCDLILAQSKSFIPQIAKYADSNRRIEYFPSWSEQLFNSQEVKPAPEVVSKPGVFNILFAGNIAVSQDFPAILKAAEALKDHKSIRWLILGGGRMADWTAKEIINLGLQDQVFMLGQHPVERMPAFFKHADALLVTLKDEAIFGMTIPGKLQVYLAAGVPILAMLNGEGAAVVEQARAGLTCSAGDYSSLAAAALKLSKMTFEERAQMGANGLAASNVEFNRDRLINQLEMWLSDLKYQKMVKSSG